MALEFTGRDLLTAGIEANYQKDIANYAEEIKRQEEANKGILDNIGDAASFVGSAIASGFGEGLGNLTNYMRSASRPDNYTPTQWNEITKKGLLGRLGDWGRDLSKEYARYYDPDSVKGILYSGLQSLPEMGADIGASVAVGTAVAPVLGTTAGAIVGTARKIPKILSWGERLKKAYEAQNRAGKLARAITPSARAVGAVPTATLLESTSEGQRAMDEYISDAMQNGTYIPDQTEYEAENLRSRVTRDNAGVIGGTNALEYALAFTPGGNKLKRFARLLGAAGLEGTQEVVQNKIPKIERGEEWTIGEKGDLGTFATGALLGGGFNAVGQAAEARQQQQQRNRIADWAENNLGADNKDMVQHIIKTAEKYNVDPQLALSIANAESNFNQDVVSGAGAIGTMQLMPETAKSLGVDPHDMKQNIEGGVKYLKRMLDAFGGDEKLAIAAYNAGPGAVQRFGGIPPYKETQDYVARVQGFKNSSPLSQYILPRQDSVDWKNLNIDDYVTYKGDNSSAGLTDLTKTKIALLARD